MLNRSMRRTVAISAIATFSVLVTACGDDGAGPEEGVTVDDLTTEDDYPEGLGPGLGDGEDELFIDAAEYVGEEVTVSGEIVAQINDRTFHIAAEDQPDPDISPDGVPSLLVLGPPSMVEVDADDVVRVSGTVVIVDRDNVGSTGLDIAEDDLSPLLDKPAIVADRVEVLDESTD